MSLPPRISLQRVCKQFAGPTSAALDGDVLRDVSFVLSAGEFVCLLGASGCGKSTILNLVAGFDQADRGEVLLDGRPIHAPGPERGMVFQQPTLFPWLSVRDNVTFGPRMSGQTAQQYLPDAERYLRLVGLQDFAEHFPWQLSGGMQPAGRPGARPGCRSRRSCSWTSPSGRSMRRPGWPCRNC
jgi:NitT/TauT family transport system ATP-binding protein